MDPVDYRILPIQIQSISSRIMNDAYENEMLFITNFPMHVAFLCWMTLEK